MYTLTYTVNEGDTLEEFGQDNVLTQDFHISSTKYSNATLDANAGLVLSPFTDQKCNWKCKYVYAFDGP